MGEGRGDRMKRRILSLDGGGIKGVFAAQFLAKVEEATSKKICDYFDLIAGTSTGGIIAAGLGLGIPAQDILELYLNNAQVIFPQKPLGFLKRVTGGQYDSEALQNVLKETFGNSKIGNSKTRLLIPSYSISDRKTVVFKTSHHDELVLDYKRLVTDVLMATTAAPTYFKPYIMESRAFIDGGIGANNPSSIALVEGLTKCGWLKEDIYLLSIGCTYDFKNSTLGKEKMGAVDIAKLINAFMNAESQYSENISQLLLEKEQYIRINPIIPEGQAALDKGSEKALDLLRSQGQNEAQKNVHIIDKIFLDEVKEDFIPSHDE